MSQKRQTPVLRRLGDSRSLIVALTYDYPAGHVVPLHFHDRDQLVYASRGVMTVRTSDGYWVVPTDRAVWIPANSPHTITMSGRVAMRTLYLRPRLAKSLPRDCCVVNVAPLLRELVLHACTAGALMKRTGWQRHLVEVILDQLQTIQMLPLQLPNPSDSRALRIAGLLLADPSDRRPLTEFCKAAGASKRTAERLFQEEVGMTLGEVAAAASPHASAAATGGRRESYPRRFGSRLQHPQRIHFHVQKVIRRDAQTLLQISKDAACSPRGFLNGRTLNYPIGLDGQ